MELEMKVYTDRFKGNSKANLLMLNEKIRDIKRDHDLTFMVNRTSGHIDMYEVINEKSHWVFSSGTIDEMHTYLCVVSNFLQTRKLAS